MEALKRIQTSPARLVTVALAAGLIVWSASQFAGLIWHVVAPDYQAVAADVQTPATVRTSTPRAPVDIAALQDVFKVRPAGVAVAATNDGIASSTTETRLALALKGAVLSSDDQQSRAIIASGDSQQFYRPGDTLENTPGTVVLQAVYQTHVILGNNGRAEILRMDDTELAEPITASGTSVTVAAAVPATSALATFAGHALTDLLRIQPMFASPGDNSSLIGLQIRHGSRQDFLSAAGLQQGDIITAVNGQRLDDVSRLQAMMAELSQARKVSLTLMRDGQDVQLTLDRERL